MWKACIAEFLFPDGERNKVRLQGQAAVTSHYIELRPLDPAWELNSVYGSLSSAPLTDRSPVAQL